MHPISNFISLQKNNVSFNFKFQSSGKETRPSLAQFLT